ncbi:Hint domain-containing protein [Roseovarius aestuariivivens]|uniref:Hint domain-containing protein n=1 Tax=Roseovarius aestuariivivens TaxID=1888910 RepID=UPI00108025D2|nr:Hint domain-containing protein [Roseovarius aestuariivivens]
MSNTFSNSGTFDGLDATLQLILPEYAGDELHAGIQLSQSGVEPQINITFAIDRSGSSGNDTGIDFTGDGNTDTFLEAQVFAVGAKLGELVNAGYDPASIEVTIVDYGADANSFTTTLADVTGLIGYVDGLTSGGTTNYAAALAEAEDAWDASGAAPTDTNILYFYSDGFPVPSNQNYQSPLNSLEAAYNPQITAVGFGPNSSVNDLNTIDSSGSATVVTTEQELLDLINTPPPLPDVDSFDVYVDGVLIETVLAGDPRIVPNPTGLTISNLNVTGYTTVDDTPQTIDVQVVTNFSNGDTLATNGPVRFLDGVVEGTTAGDLIDVNYLGDPEGDRVDNGDNIDPNAAPGELDDDVIEAGDGNDTVAAGLGDDTVFGGADDDEINGEDGDDSLLGEGGNDTLQGGDGDDTLDGGDGDDFLSDTDGTSDDSLLGGAGEDTLLAGGGDDFLDGGDDSDTLGGGSGDDTLLGGQGNDLLVGDSGADSIEGGDGNDTINLGDLTSGDADADVAFGGADEDTFQNVGAGDTVVGGETGVDNDTLDLTGGGPLTINYQGGDPTSEAGTVTFFTDATKTTVAGTLTFSEIENVIPCFTPGTRIATPTGERLVEDLREGDRIITRDNGLQEIRWVGRRDLTGSELRTAPHLKPILIRAGALGRGLPERDMMVSPQHRLLISNERSALYFEDREVLAAAKHLTGIEGVDAVEARGVSYIHFMFDQHEVVLSNGAWTESFQPGEQVLDGMGQAQKTEIFELFPELREADGIKAYQAARRSLKKHEAQMLV